MSAWTGGRVGDDVVCVLAPNGSALTLDGTNSYVLTSGDQALVIDPGPLGGGHREALLREVADRRVVGVLLTHGHADHSEGAREFAEAVRCGVRALDPAHQLGGEGLTDGHVVTVGAREVHVVATPGHTSDSLSFFVPDCGAVLTGDTVLGRGTSLIAHPDGHLGAYLESLDTLRELCVAHSVSAVWPGHGPVITHAATVLDSYVEHRLARLAQVESAVSELGAELSHEGLARRVVEVVYADVDPVLWPAAELSVRAQLDYLADRLS